MISTKPRQPFSNSTNVNRSVSPLQKHSKPMTPTPKIASNKLKTPSKNGAKTPPATNSRPLSACPMNKKDGWNPKDDEKININIPQSNFSASDRESPSFRSQENPRPTKSTENTRRLTSETPTNPAPIAATMTKFFEKIVACGLRAKGQMKEFETSSEKENISSTMNYYDDPSSTAPYKLHRLEQFQRKAEDAFTFESEEMKDPDFTEESVEQKDYEKLPVLQVRPEIPKKVVEETNREPKMARRKSANIPGDHFGTPHHQRMTSEMYLEKYRKRKPSDASGFRSHLLTPEKSRIEERFNHSSTKSFYHYIVKELEDIPINIEDDSQVLYMLNKAPKGDQVAYDILKSKFDEKYAQGMYYIFMNYLKDTEMAQNKMTFASFTTFMKDFGLFNQEINKELISILYAKRCPSKTIDFAAFIDILYKISRHQKFSKGSPQYPNQTKFKIYLDQFILRKHLELIDKSRGSKTPRYSAFCTEYGEEELATAILDKNNQLLNHIFTLYETYDIQYHTKSIIFFKDFKRFCYDYTFIPVFCTLNEVVDIFKKFQLGTSPVIDFQGFVLALMSIANIGFGKGEYQKKCDTFTKKLCKFFDVLASINSRLCDQLVSKHLNKSKK